MAGRIALISQCQNVDKMVKSKDDVDGDRSGRKISSTCTPSLSHELGQVWPQPDSGHAPAESSPAKFEPRDFTPRG